MTTLKDIWQRQELKPEEVAARAGVSIGTVYKVNRKDPKVRGDNLAKVLRALSISHEEFEQLEAGQ